MFRSNRVLALDVGSSKVVLAEFLVGKGGGLELSNYGIGALGLPPDSDADASAYIIAAVRDVMRSRGIKPGPLLMTVSGQAVFPRFVKLPPVSRDKLLQIVQYEAEQNVPFPIAEVVWDYQLVGDTEGETNVILVAVKTENIKALTDCVLASDMEPEIVDVAPMALYNAVRYNYPGLSGCTMVLDIGARTSNLLFIEESRIFSRSIPVAGNTVTQEIAKELDVSIEEAERLKVENSVVGLGGVFAGPDGDVADLISKVVRNVVTRLHAEVNRSINFYRSQQGGNAPSRVLLAGGSSIIPHMDTFFRDKLKVDVETLNPLLNIRVGGGISREDVAGDAHMLGQVVGLALRRALKCPVEINLMPPDLVAAKAFRKRQPFFALSVVGLSLIMLCWWVYTKRMTDMFRTRMENVEARMLALSTVNGQMAQALKEKAVARQKADSLLAIVSSRSRWLDVMSALDDSMIDGMWVTSLRPVGSGEGPVKQISVAGRGFADKMRAVERPDATAAEVLVERLRLNPLFSAETAIRPAPTPGTDAAVWDFEVLIGLKDPIETR
jgi:type IV pilus assembly protein PilM